MGGGKLSVGKLIAWSFDHKDCRNIYDEEEGAKLAPVSQGKGMDTRSGLSTRGNLVKGGGGFIDPPKNETDPL